MEPPWEVGMKICLNVPGHMTKTASRTIYGKNLQILLLRNQNFDDLETWYTALGCMLLVAAREPQPIAATELLLKARQ